MIFFLLCISLLVGLSAADKEREEFITDSVSWQDNEPTFISPEAENAAVEPNNIENVLVIMENMAALVEKSRRDAVLPEENIETLNNRMVEIMEDIIDQIKTPDNAYKFLNSKSFERIITPMIGTNNKPLRKQLLLLMKTLFIVAPTTMNAVIPISIVDKLLDIFENDDNLALKAHALDLMYIWLPNNPRIQARVMRLKGLEPFYKQVSKLDNSVVHTLLDLFNKILEEHIEARNNKSQRNKDDYENMKLYQMIGLIERMATPQVCNGLFNILETLMAFTEDDRQISASIFELIKNIKPFCLKLYKGKDKVIKLFDELKRYVTDPIKIDMMDHLGLNTSEVQMVVEDFAKNVKEDVRDEF